MAGTNLSLRLSAFAIMRDYGDSVALPVTWVDLFQESGHYRLKYLHLS